MKTTVTVSKNDQIISVNTFGSKKKAQEFIDRYPAKRTMVTKDFLITYRFFVK